jgi:Cu+-exporting ATPase
LVRHDFRNLGNGRANGFGFCLERGSEHPLAAAIIQGAEEKDLTIPTAQDFQSVTGKGVTDTVDGRKAALGNAALMGDHAADLAGMLTRIEALRGEGQTGDALGN